MRGGPWRAQPGHHAGSASPRSSCTEATAGVCLVPDEAAEYNPWPGVAYVPVIDARPTTTSLATRAGGGRKVEPLVTAAVELTKHAA